MTIAQLIKSFTCGSSLRRDGMLAPLLQAEFVPSSMSALHPADIPSE
jgi:hypothetical protein